MTKTKTTNLVRTDRQHLWHPFTQMQDWQTEPVLVIESARGNYLKDTDGRKYLDGVSSLWVNVHGHRVSAIDKAVRAQLGKVAHSTFLGLSHVPAIELTKQLLKVAPENLNRAFYSDSGASAVEVALKMAFQYWRLRGFHKKKTFLRLKNAYHGDTLGAVSVGGIELFHELFRPLLFHVYEAPAPYFYRDKFSARGGPAFGGAESEKDYARHCACKVENILKKHHSGICALVVEPLMQGAAGMLKQPPGYLRALAALSKKYKVLLIVDEVATGFGRTGTMFACEQEGVQPDILCAGKGITGGYLPLSVTLTSEKVYKVFLGRHEEFRAFFHGHTYSANPLACAAAIANLKIFETERTLQKMRPKIRLLTQELWKLRRLEHVGDIRQTGFMVGIELVRDKKNKKAYPSAEKRGIRVGYAARAKGVLIRPLGNVVVLMPPLSITESEIVTLCRVVRECIEEVTRS